MVINCAGVISAGLLVAGKVKIKKKKNIYICMLIKKKKNKES